jgi:hypothetical protein
MLDKLRDDCSLEDVQYHLYVIEKIRRGIGRAAEEGTLTHEEVEKRFSLRAGRLNPKFPRGDLS